MAEMRVLKINNCFQCYHNKVKFSKGYYCELTGDKNNPWCWNNEFPPHCRLLNIFYMEVKGGKFSEK